MLFGPSGARQDEKRLNIRSNLMSMAAIGTMVPVLIVGMGLGARGGPSDLLGGPRTWVAGSVAHAAFATIPPPRTPLPDAVGSFHVPAGERVDLIEDFLLISEGDVVIDRALVAAAPPSGLDGVDITIMSHTRIVVTGEIVAGAGLDGVFEQQGGRGGNVYLEAPVIVTTSEVLVGGGGGRGGAEMAGPAGGQAGDGGGGGFFIVSGYLSHPDGLKVTLLGGRGGDGVEGV